VVNCTRCSRFTLNLYLSPPIAHRAEVMPGVVIAYAVVSVIWGSTYFAIRVALETFPPFLLGALRYVPAGLLLLAIGRARGTRWPTRREWGAAAVTGALFFVVGNGMVNVAERTVSSGLVAVLVATMPLWTALFARVTGQRPSAAEVLGLCIGLCGVIVMHGDTQLRASPGGTLAALLATAGWAVGSLASPRLALPPGNMRAGAQMLTGGLALGLISLATGERLPGAVTARAVAALLYLLVFGSMIAFSAYAYLLAHARPTIATSYTYVNPVIAVVLGVALAGERLTPASVTGAVLIVGAVALVVRTRAAAKR
jgi:drug/metabolite transporter (DMT)-like permease